MSASRADTLLALRLSIARWKKRSSGITMSGFCPLCSCCSGDSCSSCPVQQYTGKPLCSGTPFDKWRCARFAGTARKYARAEYRFLIKVRDWWRKEHKP